VLGIGVWFGILCHKVYIERKEMKTNYIKHGPKGSNQVVDTIDDFVTFVKALKAIPNDEPTSWEFTVVQMSEKEFNNLPEFEGF
jgi:hypothetical protein